MRPLKAFQEVKTLGKEAKKQQKTLKLSDALTQSKERFTNLHVKESKHKEFKDLQAEASRLE